MCGEMAASEDCGRRLSGTASSLGLVQVRAEFAGREPAPCAMMPPASMSGELLY
jgi:hypothetical protein